LRGGDHAFRGGDPASRGGDHALRGRGRTRAAVPGEAEAGGCGGAAARAADRFVEDQLFDEDVRAVVALMRPHRRERLLGWTEYRTGGADFRATISWGEAFERAPQSDGERCLAVPRLVEVMASILVGSVKDLDELTPAQEFDIYRGVIRDLYFRVDGMQGCYE